jgi:hypothetical protein
MKQIKRKQNNPIHHNPLQFHFYRYDQTFFFPPEYPKDLLMAGSKVLLLISNYVNIRTHCQVL